MDPDTQSEERPHQRNRLPYSYQKCDFCRKHKKKCEPLERQWPKKCERCKKLRYECTPNRQTENRTRRGTANNVPVVEQQSPSIPARDGEPSVLRAKDLNLDGADGLYLALGIFDFWCSLLRDINISSVPVASMRSPGQTIEFLDDNANKSISRLSKKAVRENDSEFFVRSQTVNLYGGRFKDDPPILLDILRQEMESDPLAPFVKNAIESLRKRHRYQYAIQLQKDLVRKLVSQFGTESNELTGAISKYVDLIREVKNLSSRGFDSHMRDDNDDWREYDTETTRETLRMPPFLHDCLFLCGSGSPTAPQPMLKIAHDFGPEACIGPDVTGSTLLHVACGTYNSDAVETLVSLEVSVNSTDVFGRTALHTLMLGHNLKHTCRSPFRRLSSAALQLAKIETLKVLLTAKNLDMYIEDMNGQTALDYPGFDSELFDIIQSHLHTPGAAEKQRQGV